MEWQSRHFAEHVLFLIPGKIFVPPTLTPKLAKSTTSFCISNYGVDYVGDLDVTLGGHTCLQWSSKEAKALSKNKNFSLEVSLPGNKCRNPDKDPEGPWCYAMVSGNVTIDYCDLPLCGNNDKTTHSSGTTAVYGTWFLVKHLSLSSTEELLSVDESSDTGVQQRTTLSSPRKRFFNPQTFGQGEDGKPLANFNALRIKLYLIQPFLWQACTEAWNGQNRLKIFTVSYDQSLSLCIRPLGRKYLRVRSWEDQLTNLASVGFPKWRGGRYSNTATCFTCFNWANGLFPIWLSCYWW